MDSLYANFFSVCVNIYICLLSNFITHTLHNFITHTLHNFITHTLHNFVTRTLHNFITHTLHNFVTHTLHNFITHTLHNFITHTLHNCHYPTITIFPLMSNNFLNLSSPTSLIALKNVCILMGFVSHNLKYVLYFTLVCQIAVRRVKFHAFHRLRSFSHLTNFKRLSKLAKSDY